MYAPPPPRSVPGINRADTLTVMTVSALRATRPTYSTEPDDDAPAPEAPPPGTVISGAYEVVRTLGSGAMGVVVLANDRGLDRDVAIKIIRHDVLARGTKALKMRARFLVEARAMARVHHPNVVHIYAFGELEDSPYIVMELVNGITLEEWLFPGGTLRVPTADEAFDVLDGACLGLEAIHAAKAVHRDIKPSNILLDAEGGVHLADLGVAELLARARGDDEATKRPVVGTPMYMAPEIALEERLDATLLARADVYSLACVAYELFTGVPPFECPSTTAVVVAHLSTPPAPPSTKNSAIGPELDAVILRALAKDPHTRTPSAQAFRRELRAARARTTEPASILIAEDDVDFRDALEIAMRNEFPDAAIECVGDGLLAVQAFEARRHSVVLLDLQMPGMDGIEVTTRLRVRSKAMPIVVLTASGGPDEWRRLSELGADGFLLKPVNLKDVVTLVRRALGDRAALSAPPAAA
jgi:serine/threonine protein kinase